MGCAIFPNLSMYLAMALHIRDLRHSDRAGLSRLRESARRIGPLSAPDPGAHVLVGQRDGVLAGAIWLTLTGNSATLPVVLVESSASWQSDICELIAEACLWLASRGAARIDLQVRPEDSELLEGLLEMDFKLDPSGFVLRRLIPSRTAA